MVIKGADVCGVTLDGQFCAVWDGGRWIVDKDTSGCARPLASNGHGPVVVHLVTSRYKLYYEDATAGRDEKPLRLIYADGARTGEGAFAGSTTANRAVHRLAMVWLH